MLARQINYKTLLGSPPRRPSVPCCFLSTQHAHQLFAENPPPSPPSLNHSMPTHIHQNPSHRALDLFRSQLRLRDGARSCSSIIDGDVVAVAIKACIGDPKLGAQIHGFAVSSGLILYRTVPNSLMNMYSKSGKFAHAIEVFVGMDDADIVSYNTMLSGLENSADVFSFARRMNLSGVVFDPFTYSTLLSFCSDSAQGFVLGYQLHSTILKSGLHGDVFVGNALISMYSKWGCVEEAEKVFDEIPVKDAVSWNAILLAYNQEGVSYGLEPMWAMVEMMRQGIKSDHVSLTSAVSACGHSRDLDSGRQLHCLCVKAGCSTQVSVCNVLISTYAKCGITEDADMVFQAMVERNVVSWTTMISIHEDNAVALFHDMRMDGVYPNNVTFMALLHAITVQNLIDNGRMIHGLCIKASFITEPHVSNSLITMYAKFESMPESEKVFEDLSLKEVVSWNTLISGYVQNQLCHEALEAFYAAIADIRANDYTFGSVLCAVGAAEAISLSHGQRCHSHLLKLGLNSNPIVSSALLDMYAKRGSLHESERIFREMTHRTQVAWTSIISAYSRHGEFDKVINLFKEMEEDGEGPDSITFLSMLTACGRKGMVDKGREIFDSISKDQVTELSPEHYSCMVDMLGRAGRLKEAEELLDQIPGGPGFSALQSLLGACKIYGDMEVAQRIGDRLTDLQPEESGTYVLMANLFAEKGDWEKVAKVRRQMRNKGVKKEVGFSWVDVGGTGGSLYTHGFSSGDTSHPQYKEIYWMARYLGQEMKLLHMGRENKDVYLDQIQITGQVLPLPELIV